MLWIAFALMTGAAVLCVVWPLSKPRSGKARPAGDDVAFYQHQLRTLDREIASGLVPADEASGSRAEIGRRLLAAHEHGEVVAQPVEGRRHWQLLGIAAAVMIVVPAVALGVYLRIGAPGEPDLPLAARLSGPAGNQLAEAIARVESHLVTNPDDGRGFEVLAPLYMRLGRFNEAAHAYDRALTLLGETEARRAGLGQALMMAADGVVTADARKVFEQAAADDPTAPQPQFYLGLAAAEDGDKEKARAIWTKLVDGAPHDAPWLPLIKQRIAALDAPAPAAVPASASATGPASPAGAAIAALPADQRMTMIRGMVSGLAARLKQDGRDKEGWLKLVRAYAVLGEKDQAMSALTDGRKNLAADPQGLGELNGLARELGLDS